MTTANPPARYSAHVKSARTGGFATAELHHHQGRDPAAARVQPVDITEGLNRRSLILSLGTQSEKPSARDNMCVGCQPHRRLDGDDEDLAESFRRAWFVPYAA